MLWLLVAALLSAEEGLLETTESRLMWIGLKEEVTTAETAPVFRWIGADANETGYVVWYSNSPSSSCHDYVAALYQYQSSSKGWYYSFCSNVDQPSYLCAIPAVPMSCPPATSEYKEGKCSCKKGYLDFVESDFAQKELLSPGQLCMPSQPCSALLNPPHVVLVFETSGAVAYHWEAIVNFATALSENLVANTKLSVVTFGSVVTRKHMKYDWTPKILEDLLKKKTCEGGAMTHVAVKATMTMLAKDNQRKVVILVTANLPHSDEHNQKELLRAVETRTEKLRAVPHTEFYVAGVLGGLDKYLNIARKWVKTNGHYYSARTMDDLDVANVQGKMCAPLK